MLVHSCLLLLAFALHGTFSHPFVSSPSTRFLSGNVTNTFLSPDLGGYSAKFQGCWYEHVWNPNFPDSQSNPILVERYVRFRMCPGGSGGCSSRKAAGCIGKYGDYITPLSTYAAAELSYLYAQEPASSASSSMLASDLKLLGCKEVPSTTSSSANSSPNDKLFIGPVCSKQGGDISLALYSESTCSVPSSTSLASYLSSDVASSLPPSSLLSHPFSSAAVDVSSSPSSFLPPLSSLASTTCMSCSPSSPGGSLLCSSLYASSGKCERRYVLSGDVSFCDYVDGIAILRTDGTYDVSVVSKGSASAGAFVAIFTVAAVLLTFYAVHLRRMEMKRSIMLEQMGLS